MKFYITSSKTRQARVIHTGINCPLAGNPESMVEVDPASLRVFVRCKYCFG